METKQSKGGYREGLIAAIRKAVEAGGGKRISLRQFVAVSDFKPYHVAKHFATWGKGLKAAGFDFERYNAPITNAQLLADWGRVARNLGRVASRDEYALQGKYGHRTIERRFHNWSEVPGAFRNFANLMPEWADVLALLPPEGASDKAHPPKMRGHPIGRRPRDRRMRGRPVCGPPIDFPGLRNAPTNEMGVVLLFGAMAPSLGFMVESLQARFPDCEAKRLTALDEWQTVRIEFEYESRNFRDHGHDPEQCDLIVCWVHNWPECPKNIEVIALSGHVAGRAVTGRGGCPQPPATVESLRTNDVVGIARARRAATGC